MCPGRWRSKSSPAPHSHSQLLTTRSTLSSIAKFIHRLELEEVRPPSHNKEDRRRRRYLNFRGDYPFSQSVGPVLSALELAISSNSGDPDSLEAIVQVLQLRGRDRRGAEVLLVVNGGRCQAEVGCLWSENQRGKKVERRFCPRAKCKYLYCSYQVVCQQLIF